ncbi:hypothetical protein AB2S62_18255 [Vibrio sp. NTOU-M3]|uniref:SLAC1 family transporter n=1 Tax=Vibrio sp. NTOU-M3 TaxID=3234954 RepID=UPI00349F5773
MSGNTFLRLPVTLMSTVMSVAGLALAIKKSEIDLLDSASTMIAAVAVILLLCVTLSVLIRYVVKSKHHIEEMENLISRNFMCCSTISLFLISGLLHSSLIWQCGAAIQLPLLMFIVIRWIYNDKKLMPSINPTFLIPPLANVVCSVFAPVEYREFGFFMFSSGVMIGASVYLVVLHRMMTGSVIPKLLYPTYFILLATPSMFFLGYQNLTYGVTILGMVFYGWALAALFGLVLNASAFKQLDFSLAFWAYAFPLAAFTSATYQFLSLVSGPKWVGHSALLATFVVYCFVLIKTSQNRKALLLH